MYSVNDTIQIALMGAGEQTGKITDRFSFGDVDRRHKAKITQIRIQTRCILACGRSMRRCVGLDGGSEEAAVGEPVGHSLRPGVYGDEF